MIANLASLAVLGVAALSGVARAQDGETCQTALEVILEVAGPNAGQLLGKLSAQEGAALLNTVAAADTALDEKYTLFIPNDKALGDANADELSNEDLLAVLASHVIQGEFSSEDVKDGLSEQTLGGTTLVGLDEGPDGSVELEGASGEPSKIVDHDIPACSGPIHIIDKVLLPASVTGDAPAPGPEDSEAPVPADAVVDGPAGALPLVPGAEGPVEGPIGAEEPCTDVVAGLTADPQTMALAQMAATYLDPATIEVLTNPESNLTVFVPPEEDLLKLLGGVQNNLVDLDTARTILTQHVALEFLPAEELLTKDGESVPSAAGIDNPLDIFVEGEMITITASNPVQVTMPDFVDACSENAVIHGVSEVILPEGVNITLAELPDGDVTQLEQDAAAAIPPAGDDGTRELPGGAAVGPEAADSAAGVFRGLLTVGAAAVAFAVAL